MVEISREEISAFRETAASFARRSIAPILEHDSPDGDLSRVAGIMKEALDTGLLASPNPDAPGFDAGVWGRHALKQGPVISLMLLEELATACGGVAMNFHALGQGSLVLGMASDPGAEAPARVAVALCENGFPPRPETMLDPSAAAPAKIQTVARRKEDGYVIDGIKDFVYQGPDTDAYVVFARENNQWIAFLLDAETPGLELEEAGYRMGLRASPLAHLCLEGVEAPENAVLEFSLPLPEVVMEYLRLWWLGQVAIGAGMARQALQRAREYAEDRFQGCTEIINHPGMAMLLSDSEARIMICQGLIDRASVQEEQIERSLAAAAKAKLMGLYAAAGAVTDCLQVFGGYGYMEDYRMEKLYRDINTLKNVGGGPRDMRMIIAGLTREV